MNVRRRIVPRGLQVVSLQQSQLLEENRALAPGAAFEDLIPAVVDRDRRLHLGFKGGQVVDVEQSPVALHKGGDLAGDIPCIKRLASGLQTGRSSLGSGAVLGLKQAFERMGEIGVAEDRADFRQSPSG